MVLTLSLVVLLAVLTLVVGASSQVLFGLGKWPSLAIGFATALIWWVAKVGVL
jgi:hypothetical protein